MKKLKILNLYAGIGGNRKLWPSHHEVTAVEYEPGIAEVYKSFYPNDTVVLADAHAFLLDHFNEFDIIWSSPPCPSHSVTNFFFNSQGVIRYPDMKLYQEIIFLKHFFRGRYVVENVKSYYTPLIAPVESGRHFFWANFQIPKMKLPKQIGRMNGQRQGKSIVELQKILGFDLSGVWGIDKEQVLRNCVYPELGAAILQAAELSFNAANITQIGLFDLAK